MKRRLVIAAIGAALLGAAGYGWSGFQGEPALSQLEQRIASSHPDIDHISPETLNGWSEQRHPLIVLDVREEDEFAVSHLEGAVQVSPDASAEEVVQLLGASVQDADVVLYCSVGVRSSKLASRVAERLEREGANRIANLSGGVFRWHNEERPLVANGRRTELVHGYDAVWKRLVERKELTALGPISVAP